MDLALNNRQSLLCHKPHTTTNPYIIICFKKIFMANHAYIFLYMLVE